MQIVPFEAEMLQEASSLLAARYRAQRKRTPLLPIRFEDEVEAKFALIHILAQSGVSGVAAISQGQLVGYLLGQLHINSIRGRHTWIYPAGFGVREDSTPELLRDLYASLSENWVANGFFDHYILTPGQNWDDLQYWLHLGFALEQAHALLAIDDISLDKIKTNPELVIRQATQENRAIVQSFSDLIPKATAGAPVWGVALPESLPDIREGYGELLDEEGTIVWLAFLEEEAVGIHVYRTLNSQDLSMLIPEYCARLTVASTKPHARGKKVTSSLFAHALQHAKENGFRYLETDWRIANLAASRTWPWLGFQQVATRLVRKVDPRIVWANGENKIRMTEGM